MWYFSWILGLGLACTFAILNAMWLELHEEIKTAEHKEKGWPTS
jgi:cyd operon protein YbgT